MLLLGVEPQVVLENCFRQAEKMDPPPREAFLASGKLALNKHDFSLAADAFRAGPEKIPRRSRYGMPASPKLLNPAIARK